MTFLDYLYTPKAQAEAAEAVTMAMLQPEHEGFYSIGGGWYVQPKDGEWTRIRFAEERYTVSYRSEGGGYKVTDCGNGIEALLKENGISKDDVRLKDLSSWLAARVPDSDFDGDAIFMPCVPRELLPDMICRALLATYHIANRQL